MFVYAALHYGYLVGVYSTPELAMAACQRVYNEEIHAGTLEWRPNITPEEAVGVLAGVEPDHWASTEGSVEDPSSSEVLKLELDGPDRT